MGWQKANYADIRSQISSGDILAFAGYNPVSELIKLATSSPVSHLGVVLQSQVIVDNQVLPVTMNHLVESTFYSGKSGVMVNRLSERIQRFEGDVWFLPLHASLRNSLNMHAFTEFLLHHQGTPYDWKQALLSALDPLINWPPLEGIFPEQEDFQRLFCSELIIGALKAGGVLKQHNASMQTPSELLQLPLFADRYYQLAGDRQELQLIQFPV